MNYEFWQKQTPDHPLFPDVEWQRPEQKALQGKLLVIGGNAHGFAAVAQAYRDAVQAGIGQCRVVLPDALKKNIDPQALDCVFVPTNASGGITKEAMNHLKAAAAWSDGLLFVGDAGRNSETAIVYDTILAELADFPQRTVVLTRDAIDLLKNSWPMLLPRERVIFVATFAQLQKIFQSVHYPRTILFTMQLTNLVDALHKFTITYPSTIVVFHQNQLVVAQQGHVSTTPWDDPMRIWRGSVAATAAVYSVQQPRLFQAVTASLVART